MSQVSQFSDVIKYVAYKSTLYVIAFCRY